MFIPFDLFQIKYPVNIDHSQPISIRDKINYEIPQIVFLINSFPTNPAQIVPTPGKKQFTKKQASPS